MSEKKAAGRNVLGGSVQWGAATENVLRAEVEVVQEIPDLVTRGRGVACDKGGREDRDSSRGREDKDGNVERIHDNEV
jgi:hypothetical protein